MDVFRTVVTAPRPPFQLSHAHQLLSMGSCFSENIGRKFAASKFTIHINPFGQQYNPQSIAQALHRMMDGKPFQEDDLVYRDGLYHSYWHHSSFSGTNRQETLERMNGELLRAGKALQQADVLLLTLGTAHVFQLKATGQVVSNCHKMPPQWFDLRLLSPDEITATLTDVWQALCRYNPALRLVLTVSPVRYFAFGHYDNTVSKAHLFTAVHHFCQPAARQYYFPAYEMVMDDLRDYRFYTDDMVHPTHQAIEYVWQRMCETMMDKTTRDIIKDIATIQRAVSHRPRHPDTDEHREFVARYLQMMKDMSRLHGIDFRAEEEMLKKYM